MEINMEINVSSYTEPC